ncbi:MAG: glycine--tRNA ligase [Akkermansiaceae bacterium]|jgi:glycyl-tRNA synthetase|nr:glycine--tRNA ligase [Akkermansiaceae bacterium]
MANKEQTDTARMEKIVSLCKRKGFIFQSAELYGGLNGCWDYGPLGTELKRNLKEYWWRKNVQERDDILGLDGSILTHHAVLTASGHVGGFSDPMVDCKVCKKRYRADTLDGPPTCEKKAQLPKGEDKSCELTEPRDFELMFKTQMGASADENDPNATAYLRPETAQSIFVQYKNVMDSNRIKLPFGIAQIGKSFRNEINPRNFTFRSREFEQMEVEYFCRPEDGLRLTEEWLAKRLEFYAEIGLDSDKLHVLDIPDGERAHYSKKTYDIEYDFPFGQQELEGVAYRGDYDLGAHAKALARKDDDGNPIDENWQKPLEYFDEQTKEKFLPHVVEPSAGCDRTVLALICEAYDEEDLTKEGGKTDIRTVMRFNPNVAPIKAAILPLLKNKPELVAKAREVQALLQPFMNIFYDETAAIGRRYRRQDEVGTPFCIAIDFETIGQAEGDDQSLTDTITIRHRDSMEQERVPIAELLNWLSARIR